MLVQPYLFLDGRCEEALDFYRKTLGPPVEMMMRFRESPEQTIVPPDGGDKSMQASFRIGDSTVMASDGRCLGQPAFQGFGLSLTVRDEAEADRVFGALSDGGQVPVGLA